MIMPFCDGAGIIATVVQKSSSTDTSGGTAVAIDSDQSWCNGVASNVAAGGTGGGICFIYEKFDTLHDTIEI